MAPDVGAQPKRDLVMQTLERVVASRSFAGAGRQQRFLRFIVEKSFAAQSGEVKEYILALEVFDRPESFNPRTDSIVRVEARKLRESLERYYQAEGLLDPIRISLPKGGYTPVFESRLPGEEDPHLHSSRRRPWWYAAAALIALAMVGSGLYVRARRGLVRVAAPEQVRSIAVLPFANLGADATDGYFADGLTEEVIHILSSVEGLRVVARTSILLYKNQPHDFQQISEKLRVTEILEGSVRKSQGRWRTTVQLISVPSGFHLWSKEFDRAEGEAIALQEDIAHAIIYTLKQQAPNADEVKIASRSVKGPAHEAYLRGLYAYDRGTRQGLELSIGDFQRTIELDESYAPAYNALGTSYAALSIYGYWPPNEALPKAKEAAKRAAALDPKMGEAHALLGFAAAVYDWDWPEAERQFTQSIALAPGCATCRAWYSLYCLAPLQKRQEAEEQISRAVDLDPMSMNFQSFRIAIPLYTGQYRLAIERANQAIALSSQFFAGHMFLASALRRENRLAEALESARKAAEISGNNPLTLRVLAEIYGDMGNQHELLAIRDRLLQESLRHYISSSVLFNIYNSLGARDKAFEWLAKAAHDHDSYLIFMRSWVLSDEVREDPRFLDVARRVRLPSEGLISSSLEHSARDFAGFIPR